LDPEELRSSVKKSLGIDWHPEKVGHAFNRQAVFIGIYDGYASSNSLPSGILNRFLYFSHGGSAVSQFLRQELHGLFESVHKDDIPELFTWIRELGGYFKRFQGGVLKPWLHTSGVPSSSPLDLEARATMSFFQVL
jgi:protein phosphatase PTC6